MKLDGSGLTRLSERAGTHNATFNPAFTYYVGRWSDVNTPAQVRLHKADGTEVRVIDRNEVAALKDYRLSTPEFLQVKTKDGFTLEAMLIKPVDFDPARKYPVFQSTYAGPHAPQVRNSWGGTGMLYHQLLAQRGIAVWVCDNRSASGKGAESAWVAYKRLGETELADIEECLDYLKQQPWVDASRIGINGWSYGGFMTSYALTHSTSFAMGIAGGSVTDWRDYDSIYTERYMLMPQNNPDGYARTAPRAAAGEPARPAVPDPRHDGRQRPHAEHDSVRLRTAEGRQALRADAVSEIAPRRHRSRSWSSTCASGCWSSRCGR